MKILVTGCRGFLGRHLTALLRAGGADVVGDDPTRPDLRDPDVAAALVRRHQPEQIYHLAGYNGGIALNVREPARIFHDNTLMGLNLLEAVRKHAPGARVLGVVASCAYPSGTEELLCERDFLGGPPDPTVAGHAYAKRNWLLGASFYATQYGLRVSSVCPTTLYGEGDSFDPERTKVMGGLVKRFCDAVASGAQGVVCWGSGRPLREFLYVKDCARLLVAAMAHWHRPDMPLNLGSGQEVSVRDASELVRQAAGYRGAVAWDTSRPDGQFRKRLDRTLQKAVLGELPLTPLADGIAATVADYRARFLEGRPCASAC